MESESRVAAIVVTYNRKDLLVRGIEGLLGQSRPVDAIYVVDNASTDGTAELFAPGGPFDHEPIRYIRMDQNRGGAGGFKRGMGEAEQAGFDWCWIMDDDVICDTSALEELLAAASYLREQGVRVSYLASRVTSPDGDVMNAPTPSQHYSENGYRDWCEFLQEGLARIEFATFVSLLIPVDAIREIGLPIADFFMWGDDGEYTKRLTSFYGPAFCVGKSHVVHLRSVARPPKLVEETDPVRIANQRRSVRNGFIYQTYYEGVRGFMGRVAFHAKGACKVIKRQDGLVLKKLSSIGGGFVDYCLGRYDLEDLGKLDRTDRKFY